MAPAVLEALLAKYRELLRLRGEAPSAAVRPALRALASRFPGALRELDEQPLSLLAERESALAEALAGRGPLPTWAPWMASYHGWLRVGLRMKRARRHDELEDAARQAVAAHGAERPDEPATVTLAEARAMLSPPGGRLAGWVLSRVARAHLVSEADLAAALFVRPPRSTR